MIKSYVYNNVKTKRNPIFGLLHENSVQFFFSIAMNIYQEIERVENGEIFSLPTAQTAKRIESTNSRLSSSILYTNCRWQHFILIVQRSLEYK